MKKIISFTFLFLFLIPTVFAFAPLDPNQDGAEDYFNSLEPQEVAEDTIVQELVKPGPPSSQNFVSPSAQNQDVFLGGRLLSAQDTDIKSLLTSQRFIFMYIYIGVIFMAGVLFVTIKRKKK